MCSDSSKTPASQRHGQERRRGQGRGYGLREGTWTERIWSREEMWPKKQSQYCPQQPGVSDTFYACNIIIFVYKPSSIDQELTETSNATKSTSLSVTNIANILLVPQPGKFSPENASVCDYANSGPHCQMSNLYVSASRQVFYRGTAWLKCGYKHGAFTEGT